MNKYWLIVVISAVFEVGWVMGLKHSSNMLEWAGTILAIVISFSGLIYASTKISVGTSYAVFVGLGTAGTVLLEMVAFGEPFKLIKVVLIGTFFSAY